MEQPRGWYSRGYLPHIDAGSKPQFITWRLEDSIPTELIENWRKELESRPDAERKRQLYSRVERYLDEGHGTCTLRNPVAARIVQDALVFHHTRLYSLHEWTVMPNHVHVLLTPVEGVSLERLMHANKSFTSSEIHKQLGGSGRLWEPESFDRLIRDLGHFERVAQYIRRNPVKAKLCSDYRYWAYGSGCPRIREKLSTAKQRDPQTGMSADRDAGKDACAP